MKENFWQLPWRQVAFRRHDDRRMRVGQTAAGAAAGDEGHDFQTVQVGHADPERVCRLHYGIAGGAGPLESIRYSQREKIRQRR